MTGAAAPVSTRALFRSAVELVRSAPLGGGSAPAFELARRQLAASRSSGAVEGLSGDLWETAARIRSGDLSAQRVIESAYDAVRDHDGRFGAFEYVAQAQPASTYGPLAGIPITVKDVIDVAGMPTRGSSAALAPRIAMADPEAVRRLRAAGAAIMGKVATHEFALGVTTPQARSPWDASRVPGGSSGGSAISLVTGMALGSLGTDTRASIRVPAALCGLVGFKPSLGVIPIDHWLTLSWSMDHFAPMARSVRDVALLMDVLADAPGAWSGGLPGTLRGKRVGFAGAFSVGCEPGVQRVFEAALAVAEGAGAEVVRVRGITQADLDLANAVGMVISRAEAVQFHTEAGTALGDCTAEVRDQLIEAQALLATDFIRAMRLRGELRTRLAAAFEGIDVLATPTSKIVAPLREKADRYLLVLSANCIPWSLVDFPAISIFGGLSRRLPVGLQLVGAPGADQALLAAAHAFERLLPAPPVWSFT